MDTRPARGFHHRQLTHSRTLIVAGRMIGWIVGWIIGAQNEAASPNLESARADPPVGGGNLSWAAAEDTAKVGRHRLVVLIPLVAFLGLALLFVIQAQCRPIPSAIPSR